MILANDHTSLVIDQRGEDQVHMIRHHDRRFEVVFRFVVMETAPQNDRADSLRKDPSTLSAERNEMGFFINLQVRKLSSMESPRHTQILKTARTLWGQPPSAVRRSEAPLAFDFRS